MQATVVVKYRVIASVPGGCGGGGGDDDDDDDSHVRDNFVYSL